MFKVRDLRSGEVKTVYAVMGPMFLFFTDGLWCVDEMGHYAPVEEGGAAC